ncbi:hypothetical protein BD94_2320 [Elizabethkingia anophelis NUHP1]|uniref:Uncharacterized protein n=1 Tax=Elizabethkingia anophelis NUHP1 TaxID=1338011 RepID=A0A077EL22_9FLAO|nr:hypothetical protein BD94_2320 [Elizabethkingia anophelis NUHP1]
MKSSLFFIFKSLSKKSLIKIAVKYYAEFQFTCAYFTHL